MKQHPFKNMTNKVKRVAKVAIPGIATVIASHGQAQDKVQEIKPIMTNNQDDPRLKAYSDSLAAYQLNDGEDFKKTYDFFGGDISKNTSNPSKGYLGSKIEYSTTKEPLELDKSFEGIPAFAEFLKKYKPEGYKNIKGHSTYFLGPTFSRNETNGEFKNPRTKFIEDNVNRVNLKKIFPEITDSIIDEKIGKMRENPFYAKKDMSFYERVGARTLDGKQITVSDILQEGIADQNIESTFSFPIFKKPVQPFAYTGVPGGFSTGCPGYPTIKIQYDSKGMPLWYINSNNEKMPYDAKNPSPKFTKQFAYPNFKPSNSDKT